MIDIIKNKRITTYIFNIIAIIILIGSLWMHELFTATSDFVQKNNMQSNIEYIDNITSNMSRLILKATSSDIYHSLEKDKSLRGDIEQALELLVTKRYRYVYVVDKENKNSQEFRFLLDGSKNIDDKSEFKEEYTPLNMQQWDEVYKTKKPIYFEHKDMKSLWLTYLKPILVNHQVKAIIAIDFSLSDHENIVTSLTILDNTFEIAVIFSIFIFLIIVAFSYIDDKRIKELKSKSDKIAKFNETLQIKIKEEVEKNRQKDQQIIEQGRLAQMGEMISMIAHQWRQPLATVSSTSVALQLKAQLHTLKDEDVMELSGNISNYVQHLSSTIDDFREFFKSNKEKKDVTYDELISSVLNIVEISILNKNITFVKELNSKIVFHTYPNEIKQVILNLLKNAEDILLEKNIANPKIVIKTYDNILEVSDNAGGVPKDIISKIFDPYFSTKKDKNGTGLGLYMSKTIINDHCGGTLSVENDDDGAVFTIQLNALSEGS